MPLEFATAADSLGSSETTVSSFASYARRNASSSVCQFRTAAFLTLDAERLAIDDPAYLGAPLTERAYPELLAQFEPKGSRGLFRRPSLLNADIKAGESGIRRVIGEPHHPRAVGQFADIRDIGATIDAN
jgi:hypothetical protein